MSHLLRTNMDGIFVQSGIKSQIIYRGPITYGWLDSATSHFTRDVSIQFIRVGKENNNKKKKIKEVSIIKS